MEIFKFNQVDQEKTCPEIWQRIFVAQNNDTFVAKPCCYAVPRDSNQVYIKDPTSIFGSYNQSENMMRMRANNLVGKLDPGCLVCEHAEASTGSSGRTRALDNLRDQTVVLGSHVDLNLGNLCNLSCAICDPHSSTSWLPLYNKMHALPWQDSHPYQTHDRPVINDPAWFKQIKVLQLQGGEVFLQSAYVDFFTNLRQHRDLSEIEVRIFTNGTVKPSQALNSLLTECGQVDIWFSIDDIEERFEYQRRGAKWSTVLDNLRWFRDQKHANWRLGVHPTYSLLNIYYLSDLVAFLEKEFPSWTRKFGPYHIGTGPCSAHSLPERMRSQVLSRLEPVKELSWAGDFIQIADRDLSDFFAYIRKYDQATNTSYAQAHPEFWSLLTS